MVKIKDDATTVELAESTLELATQEDGVEIFGEKYYALVVQVGNAKGMFMFKKIVPYLFFVCLFVF